MENNVEVKKLVKAIADGKNVEASKCLEKIIQQKCFDRTKAVLNS